MNKIRTIAITAAIFLPIIASAQLLPSGASFKSVTELALRVIYYLMQTLFALISLYVVYITWKYIYALKEGDSKANEYRNRLIGAIIGLAVAFSLWGIITLLSDTLDWTGVGIPEFTAPKVN